MNDAAADRPRKPGIVIFVAILNFFSTFVFYGMSAFSSLAILFGAAWGVDEFVTRQMAQYAPNPNFSYGLTLIFGAALAVFFFLGTFFLSIGVGLLKGKKYAWYLQVAMSTFGLISLPVGLMVNPFVLPLGAIVNVVTLVLFFQSRVRDYFRI